MKIRIIILYLLAALVLLVINAQAFQQERLAANGQLIFLELAPADPRSLIQGDYMRLRYAVSRQVKKDAAPRDGLIVLQVDENNIARYARIHDPQRPLAENEILLRYRQRNSGARIGPESFFFQEGQAKYYNSARYGELRVSPAGDVALVGLRGEALEALGPPFIK